MPPPASSTPRINAAAAYATCRVDAVCVVGGHPSILLAVASEDGATGAGKINADGSVTPFLDHTSSWVLTYTGQPCPASAGPTVASTTTSAPATLNACTIVDMISADTGKVIVSAEGPNL